MKPRVDTLAWLALTVIAMVACASDIRPTPALTLRTPQPSASVLPSPPISPAALSSATPSPATRQPSLTVSNEFWDLALSGEFPNHPRSVRQAIRQSDLIVVGRITGATGAELTVAIEEVLMGEPQTELAGTVTIQVGPAINEDAGYVLPLERHLLCLRYVPTWMARLGRPPEEQERAMYDYSLVDPIFGPLREFDGIARATETRNPDYFPAMFEGDVFEDVVSRVRDAIASTD